MGLGAWFLTDPRGKYRIFTRSSVKQLGVLRISDHSPVPALDYVYEYMRVCEYVCIYVSISLPATRSHTEFRVKVNLTPVRAGK